MKKVYFSDDDMCTTQKLQLARVQNWFIANKWGVTEEPLDADLTLCLTCNGWSLLEEKSYDRIKKYKEMDVGDSLVVFGCLNDAHPAKVKELHDGKTISNKDLDQQIESLIPNCEVKYSDIPHSSEFRRKEDYRVYDLTKQFVNIAAGCSFSCSFCTHKPGLGERRSRTVEDIEVQVRKLVDNGVRIIVLTGMETAYYGIEHGVKYPEMLRRVLAIDDSFEVHIAQFNPVGVHKYYDELLELFKSKRVTDIQLPIQSTSKRLLRMMKRPEFSKELGVFIKDVKDVNTRAIWRTDLIVGWPTETEEELDDSLKFAVDHFDEIAAYSIELSPDLPAWKYIDDSYSDEEVERRVTYAKKYIEENGVMAHGGQQDDSTMENVEVFREKMRQEKNVR